MRHTPKGAEPRGLVAYRKTPGARYDALAARHSAMNRLGDADETANAITWLCSEAASFVNGAVLTVDGGHMVRQY